MHSNTPIYTSDPSETCQAAGSDALLAAAGKGKTKMGKMGWWCGVGCAALISVVISSCKNNVLVRAE